jgi:hypothetical protein
MAIARLTAESGFISGKCSSKRAANWASHKWVDRFRVITHLHAHNRPDKHKGSAQRALSDNAPS